MERAQVFVLPQNLHSHDGWIFLQLHNDSGNGFDAPACCNMAVSSNPPGEPTGKMFSK